jgi:hypothetical protein
MHIVDEAQKVQHKRQALSGSSHGCICAEHIERPSCHPGQREEGRRRSLQPSLTAATRSASQDKEKDEASGTRDKLRHAREELRKTQSHSVWHEKMVRGGGRRRRARSLMCSVRSSTRTVCTPSDRNCARTEWAKRPACARCVC